LDAVITADSLICHDSKSTSGPNMEKKTVWTIAVVVLILAIFIPIAWLSLFVGDEGDATHYVNFRQLNDMYSSDELQAGDKVIVKDTIAAVWWEHQDGYSYIAFESMDGHRDSGLDYDAGVQRDLTKEYKAGDKVVIEVKITQELNPLGVPELTGSIMSIRHA